MYEIKSRSKQRAKELGVEIKPSTVKNKKIDVYKDDKKIASIGDKRYKDYPTYLQENKKIAEERKQLYKERHKKDRMKKGTPGYYADKILWS